MVMEVTHLRPYLSHSQCHHMFPPVPIYPSQTLSSICEAQALVSSLESARSPTMVLMAW